MGMEQTILRIEMGQPSREGNGNSQPNEPTNYTGSSTIEPTPQEAI